VRPPPLKLILGTQHVGEVCHILVLASTVLLLQSTSATWWICSRLPCCLWRRRVRHQLTVDTQKAMGRDFHTNWISAVLFNVGGGRLWSLYITQWWPNCGTHFQYGSLAPGTTSHFIYFRKKKSHFFFGDFEALCKRSSYYQNPSSGHSIFSTKFHNLSKTYLIAGMIRRVALVRTDVSDKLSASIIRVTRIGELGTLAVTSNRRLLREPHGITSQKTQFFIVTAVKIVHVLSLCKIWGFHGGDYEEWCLLGCYAVWLL
jgi:hypothetical protein